MYMYGVVVALVLPEVTDFRDTLFSFDMAKAETGALSTYAILVVQKYQQTIDDILLFRSSSAKGDGGYRPNVGIRIIQQFEQSIYNSWRLEFT